MFTIEIGRRHHLLYLLLPHAVKMALLSEASRECLDRINQGVNERQYSGARASGYDVLHGYGVDQHEYPARALVEEVWAPGGYGDALELGAGAGYFTALIARRARSVAAVEPVPDMQAALRERCAAAGLRNVRVVGSAAADLGRHVAPASIDSALVLQSLHHFHRRPEVFRALASALRPGGRLFLVEPHHNVRRALRLLRKWLTTYRAPAFWTDEANWATHDFLTRRELSGLCRRSGFEDVRISGYWIPCSRRLVDDPRRRFALEDRLGRLPLVRHVAGVLSLQARRCWPP